MHIKVIYVCILYVLICVVLHKYLEFSICGYKPTCIKKLYSIPLEEKEWKKKPTSTIGVSQIWESPHISQSHCISNHRQKIIWFFGPVTTVCIFIIFTNMEILRWSCHFLKKEKFISIFLFCYEFHRSIIS